MARILAKAINCLAPEPERPCDRCVSCKAVAQGKAVDVVEIDAASNRGVDDIRSLREKVNFRPAELRYKVYIIDEVHQLTKEAFNALLKTLEEPPPHTVFVLATTHPQDVPATIVSRCQRFEFRRIPVADIMVRLNQVAKAEGIEAEPAAMELLARSAKGSLRDALSLLDQVASSGISPLTVQDVASLLGQVSGELIERVLTRLSVRDLQGSLEAIRDAVYQGADVRQLCREILEGLRQILVAKAGGEVNGSLLNEALLRSIGQGFDVDQLYVAIRAFVRADAALRFQGDDALPLELAVIEYLSETQGREVERDRATSGPEIPKGTKVVSVARTTSGRVQADEGRATQEPAVSAPGQRRVTREADSEAIAPPTDPQAAALAAMWGRVLEEIRPTDRRLEALLKSCQPVRVDHDVVSLGCFYEFHQRKVEEPQNRILVERVISKVLGRTVQVKTLLTPRPNPKIRELRPADLEKDELVRAALNLFNAKIVSIDPE
jgi:DNA polymerase-3 subunit gamma/tau